MDRRPFVFSNARPDGSIPTPLEYAALMLAEFCVELTPGVDWTR
jgi:hypothetical protein